MMPKANTLIIAEAGVNHNGSMEIARNLIDAAADSGADAVKFQSFVASSLVTSTAKKAGYQIAQTGSNENQLEMLSRLELSYTQQRELFEYCKTREIEFLSTPFDGASLNFLVNDLGLSTIKVGSGELTNAPFLLEVAQRANKIILSTGMSTLDEVRAALGVIAFGLTAQSDARPSITAFKNSLASESGNAAIRERVTILHCTTDYPTLPSDMNLLAMITLRNEFSCSIGLSDHSIGTFIAVSAVAMGAKVIEKHLTISRNLSGPDHRGSLEPDEFKTLVSNIRDIEQALGKTEKLPTVTEIENQKVARRSIVARTAINRGDIFSTDNIEIKRPGTGRSPFEYWELLGTKCTRDIAEDELI